MGMGGLEWMKGQSLLAIVGEGVVEWVWMIIGDQGGVGNVMSASSAKGFS